MTKFMLKSYSNTRPIIVKGKHLGNKKREFPDGYFDLDKPSLCVCAAPFILYLVFE